MKLAISDLAPVKTSEEIYQKGLEHLSSPVLRDYLKLRTRIVTAANEFFQMYDFVQPPTYLFSVFSDPLNHETSPAKMSYYGKELSLTQSLIFQKMIIVGCSDIPKVFWLSPNIRLETSDNTQKYATEFTQCDFEVRGWKVEFATDFACSFIRYVMNKCDIQKKVEILTNLKREAYDYHDGSKYQNFDIEIDGVEVCSGAEREWEYERLKARMLELEYPLEYFRTVLRLAEEGRLKPSAGAGIGIERLTKALLGIEDIQALYPFARRPKEELFL